MPLRQIKVRDYMSRSLVVFKPDTEVLDAIHALVTNRISGAPVVDSTGELVGVLSERDCLRVTLISGYHGGGHGQVRDYMTEGAVTVQPDMTIVELAEKFLSQPYRRYPVVERNRLVGIISRRDILRGLLDLR